jgi:hypothetical protein
MTLGFETAELDWFYDFMWKPEAVRCWTPLWSAPRRSRKSSRRSFRNASLIELRLV